MRAKYELIFIFKYFLPFRCEILHSSDILAPVLGRVVGRLVLPSIFLHHLAIHDVTYDVCRLHANHPPYHYDA